MPTVQDNRSKEVQQNLRYFQNHCIFLWCRLQNLNVDRLFGSAQGSEIGNKVRTSFSHYSLSARYQNLHFAPYLEVQGSCSCMSKLDSYS